MLCSGWEMKQMPGKNGAKGWVHCGALLVGPVEGSVRRWMRARAEA
jgi:hypothetical protein